jgi:hypothetical protein
VLVGCRAGDRHRDFFLHYLGQDLAGTDRGSEAGTTCSA